MSSDKFIPFPSIGQFRNTIKFVNERASFVGKDEAGNAIYQAPKDPLPVIEYIGAPKIHGTNAAITLDSTGAVRYQSRGRLLTPQSDNVGFAAWADGVGKEFWTNFLKSLAEFYGLDIIPGITICLYGEWCCGNIQSGIALSQIPEKKFIIFAVASGTNGEITEWITPEELQDLHIADFVHTLGIHNIYEFPTYMATMDFNSPQEVQNQLVELTTQVESECPVAKQLAGISGVGEGIVWRPYDHSDYQQPEMWFKVKGEKHSSSKVKTLAEVDLDKLKGINEFTNIVLTDSRLEQGISYLQEMAKPIDQSSTGFFLSWVQADVLKEEADRLEGSGFSLKEVQKQIGTRARKWFFDQLNTCRYPVRS